MARARLRAGIGGKLFAISALVFLVGMIGASAYVSRALERDLSLRAREELRAEAAVAATAVTRAGTFDAASAGPLVAELARDGHARVTWIAPDGTVIADSAVNPATLDNHGHRPEVIAARATGEGVSIRESGTLRDRLLYVARRIPGPNGAPWVLRLAVATRTVEAARTSTRRFVYAGGTVGLAAALLLGFVAVWLSTRPVRRLTATARTMVRDFSVRTGVRSADEIGDLAHTLDELADAVTAALAKLSEERDQLEAILESMAEGVLVTDASGAIRTANRALREMFSLGSDVVGRSARAVLDVPALHEAIDHAGHAHAPIGREIQVEGPRTRVLSLRLAPIDIGSAGTVSVVSDVTPLRRLERIRRDFVANVSHELRTPIAAIRAAVETLQAGALGEPDTAAEFVSIVARHAERLQRLVEDLLELSRIEAKELSIQLGPLDVRATATRVAELLRLSAERKRIQVSVQMPATLPQALADERAFEQILSNLIDNAIKYSPEGQSVIVRGGAREGIVWVSVEDHGPGIEARHLPRLFERFYRVDKGRSRDVGGTGLGLAIVKHLAEAIGASVTVESTVGKGSVFRVDLRAEP